MNYIDDPEASKVTKINLYRVVDFVPTKTMTDLGFEINATNLDAKAGQRGRALKEIRAVWTGEKRPPHKDEWFLSGNPVEAYQTPNDLTMSYHIARLVRIKVTTTYQVVAEAI